MSIRDDADGIGQRYAGPMEGPATYSGLPAASYANRQASWGQYIRIPMFPDDSDKGYWNTRLMRPAYARNWLNRAGTPYFNPIAEAQKTPRVVPGGNPIATWIVSRPQAAGQYHRLGSGGLAPQPPGPVDILRMKNYGENWTQVRSSLGSMLSQLFGNLPGIGG